MIPIKFTTNPKTAVEKMWNKFYVDMFIEICGTWKNFLSEFDKYKREEK